MKLYDNGETITKDRMQDEEWYSPYQHLMEIFCGADFYEEDDPFKVAFAKCRARLNEYSFGRLISNERLVKWVKCHCDYDAVNIDSLRELRLWRNEESARDDIIPKIYLSLKKNKKQS